MQHAATLAVRLWIGVRSVGHRENPSTAGQERLVSIPRPSRTLLFGAAPCLAGLNAHVEAAAGGQQR